MRARAVWLAFLLAGCPRPASSPTAAPASGYVLVPDGAWLREAPSPTARGARRMSGDEGCFSAGPWVLREVADEGDWVLVENLQATEVGPHCYGTAGALDGLRLRLHVRRADLALVTRREVSVSYDDGTGFTLAAGVALRREGDRYRADVDGNQPLLALPADAVGDAYPAPSARLDRDDDEEPPDAGAPPELPGADLEIDGQDVKLEAIDTMRTTVEPVEGQPDVVLVTARAACSAFAGRVQLGMVRGAPGEGCGIGIGAGPSDQPYVEAGTPLTWLDGAPAGEVLVGRDIRWPVASPPGRRCFRIPIDEPERWPAGDPPDDLFLTVCAPS